MWNCENLGLNLVVYPPFTYHAHHNACHVSVLCIVLHYCYHEDNLWLTLGVSCFPTLHYASTCLIFGSYLC